MEVITELSLIMCSCSQLIIVAVVLFYLEPIKPQFDFYFGPSVYVTSAALILLNFERLTDYIKVSMA